MAAIAPIVLWGNAAEAQILFRETFGSTNAQLPTATSTADGNWTSAACLNGMIGSTWSPPFPLGPGDSPSDPGTHHLLHFTAACTYTAGEAVWRNVTPIPVQPNTTYIFSYWSYVPGLGNSPTLTQQVVPDAGTITVLHTSGPIWSAVNTWVYASQTFTTGAATTSVTCASATHVRSRGETT